MLLLCSNRLHWQCSIPVFEGLLPEPHNTNILKLLFHFGHWHGLAKLRLHSDKTLEVLDNLTSTLGQDLRTFKATTCAAFQTKELQKEANARNRRQAAHSKATPVPRVVAGKTSGPKPPLGILLQNLLAVGNKEQLAMPSARRLRDFNLNTYKAHSLGDYVETIRQYGTTDSYSTELVSDTASLAYA